MSIECDRVGIHLTIEDASFRFVDATKGLACGALSPLAGSGLVDFIIARVRWFSVAGQTKR